MRSAHEGGGSLLPPDPRLARNLRRVFYTTGRRGGAGVPGANYGGRHTLLFSSPARGVLCVSVDWMLLNAPYVDWMLLDATCTGCYWIYIFFTQGC